MKLVASSNDKPHTQGEGESPTLGRLVAEGLSGTHANVKRTQREQVRMMKPPVTFSYRNDRKYDALFHSHAEYEVYYFHEGQCNYLIGDRIYVLKPGDLIIMHGMTLHRPHVRGDLYIRSVLQFAPGYVEKLFQFSQRLNVLQPFQELRNHRVHLTGESRMMFEAQLVKLDQHWRSDDAVDQYAFTIALMDMLLQVYRLFQHELGPRSDFRLLKEEHTQRIIDYIGEHYHEDIHLEDLEAALHLNRFYLAKTFKEVTGTTIFRYLVERRINEAKLLILLQPDLSITEVAYRVGFKHASHFSRMFRQLVAMTPDEYRKQSKRYTNES
jgi:AraC-like DNA-binding protein